MASQEEKLWGNWDRTRCIRCGCQLLPWMVEYTPEGGVVLFRPCVDCGNRLVDADDDDPSLDPGYTDEDWDFL